MATSKITLQKPAMRRNYKWKILNFVEEVWVLPWLTLDSTKRAEVVTSAALSINEASLVPVEARMVVVHFLNINE